MVNQNGSDKRQVFDHPARVAKRVDPTTTAVKQVWLVAISNQKEVRDNNHEALIRQVLDHPARIAKRADPTEQMRARKANASATWPAARISSERLAVAARSQEIKSKINVLAQCSAMRWQQYQDNKDHMCVAHAKVVAK